MDLQELKNYLRIEHEEDDKLLENFKDMAQEYIKNSVGEIDTGNKLYKLAEALLVGHWYDNREVSRIGNNSYDIPHSFKSIVIQLRHCYVGDSS